MGIYQICLSENDSAQLIRRETSRQLMEDVDFSRLVVNKPWGYEYLMYQNPFSQVWSLSIQHNESTSMHCHPHKRTALIVLEGEAVFSTLNTSIPLKPLDGVIIDVGVFHSTRSVSVEGTRVLEFETPPIKYDLIRLRDRYGRAGTFYKAGSKMDVDENGILRFPEMVNAGALEKPFFGSHLCIRKLNGAYTDLDLSLFQQYSLIVILEGSIHSRKGQVLYTVTDIVFSTDYVNNLDSHVFSDLTLFLIAGHTGVYCEKCKFRFDTKKGYGNAIA